MNRSRQITWLSLAIIATLAVVYAIQRDIRYNKEYPCDLRNRLVGARLIEDGRSPYFYKWRQTDGVRYYDMANLAGPPLSIIHIGPVSNITVSPFFLHLLRPVADIQEATLSQYWLVFEYLVAILVTGICLGAASTAAQKQTVIFFASLFLLTNGWKEHVANGQMYLFTPLLASLFYVCAREKSAWIAGGLAGLFAACLVLIRVNTVFIFLPFLLLVPTYGRRWLIAACIAPLLLGGWTLLSHRERALWNDYSHMLNDHIKIHQELPWIVRHIDPVKEHGYDHWEGVDIPAAKAIAASEPDSVYSECGNVFVLYSHVFKRPLPLLALTSICLGGIGLALFCFCRRNRPWRRISVGQAVLFGCALYMFSDLCSPIHRAQYPATQWLFPLLLAAAILEGKKRVALWWLFAGLLLNIFHFPFLKMRNTTGEYIFLAVLLVLTLVPDRLNASKPPEASVSPDL